MLWRIRRSAIEVKERRQFRDEAMARQIVSPIESLPVEILLKILRWEVLPLCCMLQITDCDSEVTSSYDANICTRRLDPIMLAGKVAKLNQNLRNLAIDDDRGFSASCRYRSFAVNLTQPSIRPWLCCTRQQSVWRHHIARDFGDLERRQEQRQVQASGHHFAVAIPSLTVRSQAYFREYGKLYLAYRNSYRCDRYARIAPTELDEDVAFGLTHIVNTEFWASIRIVSELLTLLIPTMIFWLISVICAFVDAAKFDLDAEFFSIAWEDVQEFLRGVKELTYGLEELPKCASFWIWMMGEPAMVILSSAFLLLWMSLPLFIVASMRVSKLFLVKAVALVLHLGRAGVLISDNYFMVDPSRRNDMWECLPSWVQAVGQPVLSRFLMPQRWVYELGLLDSAMIAITEGTTKSAI
ncbi:hypothetical protein HDU93_006741 [Gonapodya sp. JEL0774]|nr:hypothetical protein HDU93_006741 [Gonapodya sp. JEL0774]